jgi:dolichol-phosphate mannosyltransferase
MTVTVVIPALNEAGNVGRLIDETFRVLPQNILSEMIVIDDGSSDRTGDEIKSLISIHPRLRYIRHSIRTGQSAAIRTGVLAARSPIIATMDGDGQNDPADIPKLLGRLKAPGHTGPALFAGIRARRHAKNSRRIASTLANIARQAILKDGCPGSGCGIKVFRREAFLRLPFFTSMHRFSPALFLIYGQSRVCARQRPSSTRRKIQIHKLQPVLPRTLRHDRDPLAAAPHASSRDLRGHAGRRPFAGRRA